MTILSESNMFVSFVTPIDFHRMDGDEGEQEAACEAGRPSPTVVLANEMRPPGQKPPSNAGAAPQFVAGMQDERDELTVLVRLEEAVQSFPPFFLFPFPFPVWILHDMGHGTWVECGFSLLCVCVFLLVYYLLSL